MPSKNAKQKRSKEADSAYDEEGFDRLVGSNLKMLRKACGLGQYLGLHQTAVSRVESGNQSLTARQIFLMARLFNISIESLLSKKDLNVDLVTERLKREGPR
jgi:transcriptional regulator with XRE-family HTH domain